MRRKERWYFFESGAIQNRLTGSWSPAYTKIDQDTHQPETDPWFCVACGVQSRKLAQSTRAEVLARCALEGTKAVICRSRKDAVAAMESEEK